MKTSNIILGVLAGLALAGGHWIIAGLLLALLVGWIEIPCGCHGP